MINLLCALDSGKRASNAHDNLILKLTGCPNGHISVLRAPYTGLDMTRFARQQIFTQMPPL